MERRREASRKYNNTEHGKAAKKKSDQRPHNVARRRAYAKSEHGKVIARDLQRRRAAEAALSALLLPVKSHEENLK